ncbi:MAG: hypothetical protein M3680_30525 [Myxococcota bacterium]|nr:hypothetical protein [Myxococcota bacterium]
MLAWTAHPAKRRPQDLMLAACVIFVTAYAVLVSLQSALLAVLAVVLLIAAIAPFLLPTHYRLDDELVEERRLFVTRSRRWSELRRLEIGRAAALVSPYAQRRWLDRYRGITILFPATGEGAERAAVIAALESRVKP